MRCFVIGTLAAVLTVTAWADDLNGKKITMKTGEGRHDNLVLSLPWEGAAPENARIVVREGATAKSFPATLADGVLTFISEGGMPNSEHTYTVEVEPLTDDSPAPRVVLRKQEGKEIVDVLIDDVLFTAYHYGKEWKKPFLWPVNGEDGYGLTRDWPMDENADVPKFAQDHVHHKSLWSAHGEVRLGDGDDYDLWGEEGDHAGDQVVNEVTFGSGDAYGWILSKNTWKDAQGNPLIDETREYRFYATPDKARFIDAKVTFTATYGQVTFQDTKEGGTVSVRMNPDIAYKHAVITNSLGDEGEDRAWGKPAPWCDYSAEVENVGWRGIAIFDNPKNFRFPTCWHVRLYGLMAANRFGYSYFGEDEDNKGLVPENGDYTFEAGSSLTFDHRVYIHSGSVRRANVDDRYNEYANPPEVAWSE